MKAHMKAVQASKEKKTILWDMDTVYVSGVPNCIVVEKSGGFLMPHDYSVRSLQNKELAYVKHYIYNVLLGSSWDEVMRCTAIYSNDYNTIEYYTWRFADNQKVETPADDKVFQMVAENNLVQGDHLNTDELTKFIALSVATFPQDTAGAVLYNTVNRNRSADIKISGDVVTQDNVAICKLELTDYNENGTFVKIMRVYLPNGTMVAEGKSYLNSYTWMFLTIKDKQMRGITVSSDVAPLDIVRYLINGNYL